MTFDEIRELRPDIGLTLYAQEPGGLVTLEILSDGEIYTYLGATAQAALDTAFPPPEPVMGIPMTEPPGLFD